MRYIVFDLEWNMAGGRYEEVGRPRIAKRFQNQQTRKIPTFEIFQIGAVCLDENIREISRFEQKIKPQIYPEINKYVRRLTGIEQQDLKEAPLFDAAICNFYEWIWSCLPASEQTTLALQFSRGKSDKFDNLLSRLKAAEFLFCVWSTSDANPLKSNLRYYNINDTLPAAFLDLQNVYARFSGDQPGVHSVKRAIEFLNLPDGEDYHDALNDAHFTAAIMRALLPALRLESWLMAGIPLPEKYLPAKLLAKLSTKLKNGTTYAYVSRETGYARENDVFPEFGAMNGNDVPRETFGMGGNREADIMESNDVSRETDTEFKTASLSANLKAIASAKLPASTVLSAFDSLNNNRTAKIAHTARIATIDNSDTTKIPAVDEKACENRKVDDGEITAKFDNTEFVCKDHLFKTIWESSLQRPGWLARKQTTTALIAALQSKDRQRRKISPAQLYSEQTRSRNKTENICTLSDIEDKLRHKLELLGAEELAQYLLTLTYDPNGNSNASTQRKVPQKQGVKKVVDNGTQLESPQPIEDHLVKRHVEN